MSDRNFENNPGRNRNESVSGHDQGSRDLQDNPRDQEKMKSEEVVMNLPDPGEIPGQEHVHAPPLGELADVTISSDDEEGASVFDDGHEEDFSGEAVLDEEERDEPEEDDTQIVMGTDADVSEQERTLLDRAEQESFTEDNTRLRRAELDSTDLDGSPLNESSADISGSDLDVPGAEADDENEAIGEEDEENNQFSQSSAKEDNIENGTV